MSSILFELFLSNSKSVLLVLKYFFVLGVQFSIIWEIETVIVDNQRFNKL